MEPTDTSLTALSGEGEHEGTQMPTFSLYLLTTTGSPKTHLHLGLQWTCLKDFAETL